MKKKLIAMMLTVAVVLGCAACGGGGADADGDSGAQTGDASGSNTVVAAIGAGFSTLDPGYVYEKNPPLIVNACYENLFKFYSNDGAAEPCLADTYEFSTII